MVLDKNVLGYPLLRCTKKGIRARVEDNCFVVEWNHLKRKPKDGSGGHKKDDRRWRQKAI